MINNNYWFVLLLLFVCCQDKQEPVYQLSDKSFESALLDLELAREASRTASANLQDSLYQTYFLRIAEFYDLTEEELTSEIRNRMTHQDEFEKSYEGLRSSLDSMSMIDLRKKKSEDNIKK